MTDNPDADPATRPQLFALAAAVYVRRDEKILVLKRAGGEVSGGWYIPGGAHDPGEGLEETARRELQEETGLVPDGALTVIGIVPMHVYGADTIQVSYACDCAAGEVVLSDEHAGARWIEPRQYRERYFGDDAVSAIAAKSKRVAAIIRAVRDDLDRYIAWAGHQAEYRRLQATH